MCVLSAPWLLFLFMEWFNRAVVLDVRITVSKRELVVLPLPEKPLVLACLPF